MASGSRDICYGARTSGRDPCGKTPRDADSCGFQEPTNQSPELRENLLVCYGSLDNPEARTPTWLACQRIVQTESWATRRVAALAALAVSYVLLCNQTSKAAKTAKQPKHASEAWQPQPWSPRAQEEPPARARLKAQPNAASPPEANRRHPKSPPPARGAPRARAPRTSRRRPRS